MSAPINARRELGRTAAAIALAHVHVERLERVLEPSLALSIAAMLRSDLESADARVQWLRERLAPESGERAA